MSKNIQEMMGGAIRAGEDPGVRPGEVVEKVVAAEPVIEATPVKERVVAKSVIEQKPVERPQAKSKVTSQQARVSQENIHIIISLYDKLNSYDGGLRENIFSFLDAEDSHELIYNTLNYNPANIEALIAITESKAMESAERAFFLVASDLVLLNNIQTMLSNIVEIDTQEQVTASNKINSCKTIEYVIDKISQEQISVVNEITEFLRVSKGVE